MFYNTVKISSSLIHKDVLKESFSLYPKNLPNYFKNIPKKYSDTLSIRKDNTIKNCSGFINYFRNMMSFKSPCDIEIIVEGNMVTSNFGANALNDNKRFSLHDDRQLLSYVVQDKYITIGKFMFDIKIKTDAPIIITNPWWEFNDFEIIPGVLNSSKYFNYLNLFIPIPKNKQRFFIKKGQVLANLLFETDKKIKIKFQDDIKEVHLLDYYFSVLKKLILPKRIKND
jgi:hypothetical protein